MPSTVSCSAACRRGWCGTRTVPCSSFDARVNARRSSLSLETRSDAEAKSSHVGNDSDLNQIVSSVLKQQDTNKILVINIMASPADVRPTPKVLIPPGVSAPVSCHRSGIRAFTLVQPCTFTGSFVYPRTVSPAAQEMAPPAPSKM